MNKFEHIDISGDVGLRVWGLSCEELFVNAALGMGDLITDILLIEVKEEKKINLLSDNIENLFIQWLNELIFSFDTYGFIGKTFHVNISPQDPDPGYTSKDVIKLDATVSGGYFVQDINESRLLIKAATYHDLYIKKSDSTWEAQVIFDI